MFHQYYTDESLTIPYYIITLGIPIESVAISLEYNHTSLATLNYHIAFLRTPKPHTFAARVAV